VRLKRKRKKKKKKKKRKRKWKRKNPNTLSLKRFCELVYAYKNKAGCTRLQKDKISSHLREFAKKHNIKNSAGVFYKSYHNGMIMKLNHHSGLKGGKVVRQSVSKIDNGKIGFSSFCRLVQG
jgi:hypothetical protein